MLQETGRFDGICQTYQRLAREAVENAGTPPGDLSGRGIVTCAGGAKYFPCVWVTLHELRRLGCDLPVEVWHLGRHEMTPEMEALLAPLGVKCVDASQVRRQHPARILNGWELKPYSILHSAFEEVLFLDADNVPVRNPAYLFDAPEYRHHGAVFWPDYGRLAPFREIWHICNVPFRDEPEFESGQIVVDKRRCWRELSLTMHLNEHSDFYYQYIHGDKETFHMAWRMLETPYAMPPFPIYPLQNVMCQHDFQGQRVFQHRNLCKFKVHEHNTVVPGFWNERECRSHLDKLQSLWTTPPPELQRPTTTLERQCFDEICLQATYWYERIGYDVRPMRFERNQRISVGTARLERTWEIAQQGDDVVLRILGDEGITCELLRDTEGAWCGQWSRYERMPIRLQRITDNACCQH
jgi:hypothetical protein